MTTSKPKLRTGIRMSADEYLALPEIDEYRWLELDDGELYFMPRPRRGHQFLSSRLLRNSFRQPFGRISTILQPRCTANWSSSYRGNPDAS